MNIQNIDSSKLSISPHNVRKNIDEDEDIDETKIIDLANDIKNNGLLNPLTVMKNKNGYEIIAGQRRFLAMSKLNRKTIPCNIIEVSPQQAKEISLVENIQRNSMKTIDKINSFSNLYEFYNNDIDKIASVTNISKQTIRKYLNIKYLPESVLKLLDIKSNDRITIDVAIQLSKLSSDIDITKVLDKIKTLSNAQKIRVLRKFDTNCDIDELDIIQQDIFFEDNKIEDTPPYVFDIIVNKNIIIPEDLYGDIVKLIKEKVKEKDIKYC